jgi:hypothetical protein
MTNTTSADADLVIRKNARCMGIPLVEGLCYRELLILPSAKKPYGVRINLAKLMFYQKILNFYQKKVISGGNSPISVFKLTT